MRVCVYVRVAGSCVQGLGHVSGLPNSLLKAQQARAAEIIQANWRMYSCRRAFRAKLSAIATIQRFVRTWIHNRSQHQHQQRQQEHAALAIQVRFNTFKANERNV